MAASSLKTFRLLEEALGRLEDNEASLKQFFPLN